MPNGCSYYQMIAFVSVLAVLGFAAIPTICERFSSADNGIM